MTSSVGPDDQSSSFVATVSVDMSMVSDVSLSYEVGHGPLTLTMNPAMPSMHAFDNLALETDTGYTFNFAEQLSAQHPQGGLLAMMGPSPNHFSESAALSVSMYGDLGTMEDDNISRILMRLD